MHERRFIAPPLVAAALLGLIGLGTAPAQAQLQVQAYAIDDFQGGQCGGSDRSWSAMIGNWYYNMGLFGHSLERFRVDGNFNRSLLCDPDAFSDCRDHNWADSADVAMLGLHGSHNGNHWQGTLRKNGGASVNDCNITAPDGPGDGELFLGDKNLEFFHFSSCNSMDDDYMPTLWRLFEDANDSPGSGRRLHQATGFHGMMGISSTYHVDYLAFALAAQFASIKDAWMDTMYHPEMENVKCPVAYAVGTSRNNCFNRIDTETYLNVHSDPSAINYYCYYFYDRCDPALEDPFIPPNK